MKTKPELGSNHLHGKHVGNQEDPTSCGSHHHPQIMFFMIVQKIMTFETLPEKNKSPIVVNQARKQPNKGLRKLMTNHLAKFEFT